MTRFLLSAVACFVLSGCGVSGSASCDFRDGGTNGSEPRCQERVDTLAAEAFKATCGVARGVAANGRCARADSVGGCEVGTQGDGSKVNDWYYPPKTRSDAEADCMRDNGKFLAP
jgi:hypothetical protein